MSGEGNKEPKEKIMSDNRQDTRVLIRMGARQLTESELNKITGGHNTRASQFPTGSTSDPDLGFDS
jgi:bacteriocin-like protein